jgi:hypothetical protein
LRRLRQVLIAIFGFIAATTGICDDHDPFTPNPEFAMNTYVAIINGKAVWLFVLRMTMKRARSSGRREAACDPI